MSIENKGFWFIVHQTDINLESRGIEEISKISLDSDSSGDDGGEPPRKKTRRTTHIDSAMQSASNGCVQNGAPSCSNGADENEHGDTNNGITLSQTSQEIVRLIGQYLKDEGLKWVIKKLCSRILDVLKIEYAE